MFRDAQARVSALTDAQRRVLYHLQACCNQDNVAKHSSRQLAATLNLDRRTIQRALIRLNDLELICTTPGSPVYRSEHTLMPPVSVLLDGGGKTEIVAEVRV